MHTADFQTPPAPPSDPSTKVPVTTGSDGIQRRTCDFHVAPWRVGHLSRVSYVTKPTVVAFCCCVLSSARRNAAAGNSRPSPRQSWIELALSRGAENRSDSFWLKSRWPRVQAWQPNFTLGRFFYIFHIPVIFSMWQLHFSHDLIECRTHPKPHWSFRACWFIWRLRKTDHLGIKEMQPHPRIEETHESRVCSAARLPII